MDCKLESLFTALTSCLQASNGKGSKCKNKAPWLTQIDTCLSYKCVTYVTIGVAGKINELGAIMSLKSHLGTLLARDGDP